MGREFRKVQINPHGKSFWVEKRDNGQYYPYATMNHTQLGIVSPGLVYLYSQEKLREAYENAIDERDRHG